ncbi:MAG: dihydrodipicolinate synthase family protein [Acidimicrobiia bacterium]
MPPVFTGVGVALVTLFDDAGDVDASATAMLAAQLVDAGVQAAVVAGSTGEAAALGGEERVALLEAVRSELAGAAPVIAGTGAPSARQAAALTRDAVAHGADALLVLSPPRSVDLDGYYGAVAAAAGTTPVLAYHYPDASPPGIPLQALSTLPGIAGLKDSSGDPERLLRELASWDRPIYTGSSAILSFAGPLGCAGAILTLANVEPERCIEAFAGDADAQRALTLAHAGAHEAFPRRLKEMVAGRFGTSPVARL